jgi:hypothetical protein
MPKVSPLRGMAVDAWIAKKTKGWQADAIHRLVELTQQAAPAATVSIKWGQPVFEHNGPMVFIKPAKAHVTYGFWRGAELGDDALEGGAVMKHIKVTSVDAIDARRIQKLVRTAVKLNTDKGDPTRRAR